MAFTSETRFWTHIIKEHRFVHNLPTLTAVQIL